MRTPVRIAAAAAFLAVCLTLVVACSNGDEGGSRQATSTPASQPTATQPAAASGGSGSQTVTIVDFGYNPASLTARSGQQTTFNLQNTGNAPHTFTIDGLVDSGRIASGASGNVQFTPTQAGSFTYYCTIHGRDRMSGTLTVAAGASGAPSAPPQQPAAPPGGGSSAPSYDGSY